MKRCIIAVFVLILSLPGSIRANEPTNAELLEMIKSMERRFETAMEQADKALAEVKKARRETAAAKEEAARANAELARLKAQAQNAGSKASPADPAIAEEKTGTGFHASVQGVYWRPSRSHLDYVVVDPVSDNKLEGSSREIDPGYDGGGRFSLGYDFSPGSSIQADFLKLKSNTSSDAQRPAGGELWGSWLHVDGVIDDNDVTSARAEYALDVDQFDISAKKSFDLGRSLSLSGEAGLRYARLKQTLDIQYRQDFSPVNFRISDVQSRSDFTGWGPRLGAGVDWYMGKGFSLIGSLGGSLLMGKADAALSQYDRNIGVVTPVLLMDLEDSGSSRVVPVIEMRTGLAYAYQMQNGMEFRAQLGYEWQNWFNITTARLVTDDVDAQLMSTDTTDFALDGFFLETTIRF
ncbi:MAG: outer membrane beta-barrel protein [Desulfobacter sp.]|nr:MAG: outer membrane beta-barrel protein [Desulfobacter sp.]